ncbi:MAG: hypothetical protein ACI822_002982, partial [Gammaproteobacteria bacterium]
MPLAAFANTIDFPTAHVNLPVSEITVSGNDKT